MRKIVYYVASSIDGFICGPDEDISGFNPEGNGVTQYLEDLKSFDTVIMGRKTYEFGYKYGLQKGQPAYEHMDHYIFSNNLNFEDVHEKVNICNMDLDIISNLKVGAGSDIYLCGGGQFAAWLLENELIDILKLKLNPFIQGRGTKLFENSNKVYQLRLLDQHEYENGLQIISYGIIY